MTAIKMKNNARMIFSKIEGMVQVRVSEGLLEGEIVQNELCGHGQFYSFKGVPYAQPPIGDLRFKAPQPPQPWNGVRSAKEHGPVCYQYDPFITHKVMGSEDCLYLNVYTPEIQPAHLLPVMVWIHGGGFTCGSGNDDLYAPDFLIRHGVILVTINYRLEALGFLCLDTPEVSGNAGMKDQVAALRWVKKNIASFGGDADNVTIFGESAGGASVSFHLFSPMSKGLFKRAIIQSGATTNWWANSFEPRQRAIALAKKLGCDSEDDNELYEFLKSVPVEKLVTINAPITFAEMGSGRFEIQFRIVKETQFSGNERFFYDGLLSNGVHEGVEVMTGYCEDEGTIGMLGCHKMLEVVDFIETFVPKHIALACSMKDQFEIGRIFKNFYCKGEKVSAENILPLAKYLGTEMFVYDIIRQVRMISKKNKSYLYKFTCKSERNIMAQMINVSEFYGGKTVVAHGDDTLYLFPVKLVPLEIDQNSETFKMINNVTEMWSNFAKYGNPTPNASLGTKWLSFSEGQQNYLDIGDKLVPGVSPEEEEIKLWDHVFSQYGAKTDSKI